MRKSYNLIELIRFIVIEGAKAEGSSWDFLQTHTLYRESFSAIRKINWDDLHEKLSLGSYLGIFQILSQPLYRHQSMKIFHWKYFTHPLGKCPFCALSSCVDEKKGERKKFPWERFILSKYFLLLLLFLSHQNGISWKLYPKKLFTLNLLVLFTWKAMNGRRVSELKALSQHWINILTLFFFLYPPSL